MELVFKKLGRQLGSSQEPPPDSRVFCMSNAASYHTALSHCRLCVLAVLLTGATGASAQTTDYDDNDNGLIDIRNLAQLNAMRWDLDGDGVAVSSASTTYNAAFPTPAAGMGCPDTDDPGAEPGPCVGYELRNDLDFDTDGSGSTWTDIGGTATSDANDAYHNGGSGWDPIGTQRARFNTTFDGGGKIVWNLFVKRSGDYRGLFGATGAASRIMAVGVANARVQDFGTGGALVGLNGGRIAASWSSGFVQGTTAPGGLVGLGDRGGQVVASYSTADVVCTGGGGSFAGAGLVGYQGEHGASIVSSYSTGTVTGACPNRYGLVQNAAPATVASSYWDADLSGVDDDGNMASPEGRSTAQLQAPTAYGTTTPYSAWDDVDVDGDGVAGVALDADDDAWDFGTARQHPVLKFGGFDTAVQFAGQAPSFGTSTLAATFLVGASGATVQVPAASHSSSTLTYTATGLPPGLSFDADGTGACMAVRTICGTPTSAGRYTVVVRAATGDGRSASLSFTVAVGADYDDNDNGLIDIRNLAQLNAMRWDLDGDGVAVSSASTTYNAAFPTPAAGMAAPDTDDPGAEPGPCVGYELRNDLDFDTDGSGSTWTDIGGTATSDANDAYHNGGSGWDPIGTQRARFNTTFDGGGKIVWNLFVKRSGDYRGLFGATGAASRIMAVGVANARVQDFGTGGALVGLNGGRIAASWSSGFVQGTTAPGGLVGLGDRGGQVVASYSTADVVCTGGGGSFAGAGLVGYQGEHGASIVSSYSTGTVTGACPNRYGLVQNAAPATVASSYWDADLSGVDDDGNMASPEGRSTAQLQAPTAYGTTTPYSAWDDVDVDGDGVAGVALDADDDAWDFGTARQHPVLKFGGFDTAVQFAGQAPSFGTSTLAATFLVGASGATVQVPAASHSSSTLTYTATGLPPGLSFDADGTGACMAVRTICGTPTSAGRYTVVVRAATGDGRSASLSFTVAVGGDYDDNDNGLIDIRNLAQLNAMRWDLDGDGVAVSSASTTYNAAFPTPAAGMGCPDTDDPGAEPGPCVGYELRNDLDFDTDGSGSTWTDIGGTATSDANDAYHNGGSGWDPIGTQRARFNTTFDGGGKIVWNLFVKRSGDYRGLFGATGAASRIMAVGVANARVQDFGTGGALVGLNGGRIAASWSSGFVQGTTAPGGLVGLGDRGGQVVASYSTADVVCTGDGGSFVGAGLVGYQAEHGASIVSSYSTGTVTGACPNRYGLVQNAAPATVASSYWDADLSGVDDDGNMASPEGRSTAQLQAPTAYGTTTPYSAWDDVDVDGDGVAGVALDADDDAWDFGTARQHPVLKFGGFDTAVQFAGQAPSFGTSTLAATFLVGASGATVQVPAASHSSSTLTYTATGLPPGLSFDADGTGACMAVRTICGTPTSAGRYTVVVRAATGDGRSASLSFTVAVGGAGLVIDADPSTPGTVDAGPLALVEDAADGTGYTVKLATAPTGPVTVTVASGDSGAVTVDTDGNAGNGVQSTLTFTEQNWSAAQAVTARAVQDLDPYDESVEIAHTASGGGYAGVSAPLTATVDDDEPPPRVVVDADPSTSDAVDAGPLILDEATARSGSYAVRLSFAPSATTTVAVASDNAAVAVDTDAIMPGAQATLTFTPTDWDTWRTVTATTAADADTADEAANVAHAASGADEYVGVSEILRVGVHDAERVGADYDADEDGLIEIASLAQLNAVRWDLDGDGAAAGSATTTYAAAFPGAAAGMGCPDGTDSDEVPDACAGYELTRDLDFDTDGSGSTWTDSGGTATSDANDAYHNGGSGWDPIGTQSAPFNTTFDGGGKVVWNLFVKRGGNFRGLFGATGTASRITSVGVANARVQDFRGGGATLVGFNRGRIAASWSSGFVQGVTAVGGLVGQEGSGAQVVASYSTVEVVCAGGGGSFGAGLVGYHNNASIVSSYSTGTVTGSCPNKRGLAYSVGTATVASSYWDTDLSDIADDNDLDPPEGRSSARMRAPTAYGTTTLYSAWDDVDVDGDGVAGAALDADAWDFGTDRQHPVLKFGGFDTAVQFAAQPVTFGTSTVAAMTFRTGASVAAFAVPAAVRETIHTTYTATGLPAGLSFDADGTGACGAVRTICGTPTLAGTYTVVVWAANGHGGRASLSFTVTVTVTDYDDNDNGLIDIRTLAQLNAVRWDLDGDGIATTTHAAATTTYAAAFPAAAAGMGCPDTAADVDSLPGPCVGYELRNDLDFDTDGDGDVDADDPNTIASWTPIGGAYSAAFDGNNHVIEHLTIDGTGDAAFFDTVSGTVRGVGLKNVDVRTTGLEASALVRNLDGAAIACWSSGRVSCSGTFCRASGLAFRIGAGGRLAASFSTASVTAHDNAAALAMYLYGGSIVASYAAGPAHGFRGLGLVFYVTGGTVRASYSRSAVTHSGPAGGVGGVDGFIYNPAAGAFEYNYWDTTRVPSSGFPNGALGKTAAQLQGPTSATGIYANWDDLDVAGDGAADEDPWRFGTDAQYPVLGYDGMDAADQFDAQPPMLAVVVDADALILDEAAAPSGSYAVRLSHAPPVTTTVAVASDNAAVAVDTDAVAPNAQATLTFTPTDWNTWQTVAATTTGDADAVDEVANVAHIASSTAEYVVVSGTLRVGVRDAERAGTDYDSDEDGLIEIASLAQLNAVRWDLDGDGAAAGGATTTYEAAFPGAAAGMGCPDGSDPDEAPDACAGYELTADLDFDTDGSGSTWTDGGGTAASDANDAYHNGGGGWDPIGTNGAGFNTTFDGNGKVVWNLFVKRGGSYRGLFGVTGMASRITSVGLANARVQDFGAGGATLVGFNRGRIAASWSSGFVRGTTGVGGLVGQQGTAAAQVVASYSTAAVVCVGGGGSFGAGLVGYHGNPSSIESSYSTGSVTGGVCPNKRGLAYSVGGLVSSSYWDTDLSNIGDDGDADSPEGRSSARMRAPTAYGTTLYSAWDDVDVDGDGVAGAALDADDDAWDFGTDRQHPVLKFGGFDTAVQFAAQPVTFGTSTVAAMEFRAGVSVAAFAVPAAVRETIHTTYTATGLPAGLSFDADGTGACGAARTICGTPTLAGTYTVVVWAANGHGGRASLSFTVTVTVRELVIDAAVTLNEGGMASSTVRLATRPTGPVTVAITDDHDDVTVEAPAMLTFSPSTWNTAQTFTIRAREDDDGQDETATLTLDPDGADYVGVASATTTVNLLDDDPRGVTLSALTLSVPEGGSAEYTVRLDTQPTGGDVTVTVGGAGSGISASPAALTFTGTNWRTRQTVTVSAVEDGNPTHESVILTHAVSGADYGREGVAVGSVRATATDNDTPSLRVAPTALVLVEEGASATYAVRLNTPPTSDVVVTVGGATAAVSADADGDALGVQTALTFTTTDWDTAQTVTVSAPPDDDATNATTTLTHAVAGPGDYASLALEARPGVSVTVDDDDEQGILIDADPATPAVDGGPLALHEQPGHADNAKQYTVRLATQPTDAVQVSIESGDRAVSVNGAPTPRTRVLTFSMSNWRTAQTVTATAAQDDDASSERVAIAHEASGGDYGGQSANLTATTVDDDTPALLLATSTLAADGVREGSTATYAVRLATEPSGTVTVAATATATATAGVEVDMDGGQAGLQSSLRFDATNWSVPRTATVRGLPDDDAADGTATLRHAASGADYGSVAAADTTFAVTDDDTPAVLPSATALTVNEGSTATYTVRLATRPVGGDVTVAATSTNALAATVQPARLRFGTGDWDVPKTFRVRGAQAGSATISHAASGADYGGAATTTVAATVRGTQAPGVRIEPPTLTLREGESGTYAVRLNTDPGGSATVTATSGSAELAVDADATPQTRELTFTTENWRVEQTVTVTAASDEGVDDETATVAHAVSGYAGVASAPDLVATVRDNDVPGLLFEPAEGLQLEESGTAGTYAARLRHAPSGPVAVAVSSDDAGLAVDTSAAIGDQDTLMFSTSTWRTAQTVTVRAEPDGDAASETAALLHMASGGGYDGVSATYAVRVSDSDAAPAPTGVAAASAGPTSLAVRWTPSPGAESHLVQWRLAGQAWSASRQLTLPGGAAAARIDGLATGAEYEVRVLGVNRGDPGEPSAVARATPTAGRANRAPVPLDALEDMRLEPGETWTTDLVGAFQDPDGDALSYEVLSLDETVASASASGSEMRLQAVDAGQATVYVWAVDPGGLQASQTLLATVSSERPTLSATVAADAPEGGAARLLVDLSASRRTATRFLWSTVPDADPSTADADAADFAAASGEATIPAGATRAEVAIGIADDAEIEPAREWFEVSLSVPDGCCAVSGARARMAVLEGVCDRTPAVRDALRGEGACSVPTPASLAAVRTLAASDAGSLRAGDFGGLSGLRTLDLSGGGIGSLPAEAFADLGSLRELDLSNNALAALSTGTFAALSGLRTLDLSGNALATLPESPFSNLSRLRTLLLEGNAFETLPMGLFAGLGGLREASLLGNPGAPFALAVELARTDAEPWAAGPATVEARIASAAPFALRVVLSAEPVPTDPDAPLPSAAEIAAGESSGTLFRVVAPTLWLRTGPVVLPSDRCGEEDAPRLCFRGFTAALGPALTLFGHPLATQSAPRLDVLAGGDGLRLPVAWLVAAGAAADLRWRASSSDDSVATARIRDGMLEVEPEPGGEGAVEIVLVAMDDAGLATTVRFSVQVEFHWPLRQVGGWRGAMAAPARN